MAQESSGQKSAVRASRPTAPGIPARHSAAITRLARAWMLRRSPVILLLFRTASPALEQSAAAADIEPSDEDFAVLDKLT